MKINRVLHLAVAALMLAWPLATTAAGESAIGGAAQNGDDAAAKNAQQARAALDRMVQALGGQAWLDMKNQEREGFIAAFFHGNPDAGTTQYYEFHQWPDKDRVDVTKHRDVVEFYLGNEGWEVTYRGKKPMDKELLDDFIRRRDHSIETAIRVWMKDPNTILVYEGQHLVERRLGEQVTLISAENESITILMDTQTHLPLERTFQWRDPLYKDKNTDAEEYDDYHTMDGFATPLSITRYKNGEMWRQYYIKKVTFNQELGGDFWSVDAADHRIKK
jgi:hypothetical protein